MKAYEVLEQYNLCKGWFAKDKDGNNVTSNSATACSFCTLGAIDRAYPSLEVRGSIKNRFEEYLHKKTGDYSIARWSDAPNRTKEEVISVLKELDI